MENLLSLDDIKRVEIGILDYVVSICEKHNLRYYLMYGTLIGAIRHKGFIPWDDDIDIIMPRPDYEKLLDISASSSHPKYQLLSSRDKGYLYGFSKFVDKQTKIIDDTIEKIPGLGIWVDIFPYDGMTSENSWNNKFCYYLNKFRGAAVYKDFPQGKGANYLTWKLCRLIGYRFFLKLYERFCKLIPYDTSKFVGLISDKKDYYDRTFFNHAIKVEFEGKEYNAPVGYDHVLKHYYGDYMQLPPEEQRVSHHIKAILI